MSEYEVKAISPSSAMYLSVDGFQNNKEIRTNQIAVDTVASQNGNSKNKGAGVSFDTPPLPPPSKDTSGCLSSLTEAFCNIYSTLATTTQGQANLTTQMQQYSQSMSTAVVTETTTSINTEATNFQKQQQEAEEAAQMAKADKFLKIFSWVVGGLLAALTLGAGLISVGTTIVTAVATALPTAANLATTAMTVASNVVGSLLSTGAETAGEDAEELATLGSDSTSTTSTSSLSSLSNLSEQGDLADEVADSSEGTSKSPQNFGETEEGMNSFARQLASLDDDEPFSLDGATELGDPGDGLQPETSSSDDLSEDHFDMTQKVEDGEAPSYMQQTQEMMDGSSSSNYDVEDVDAVESASSSGSSSGNLTEQINEGIEDVTEDQSNETKESVNRSANEADSKSESGWEKAKRMLGNAWVSRACKVGGGLAVGLPQILEGQANVRIAYYQSQVAQSQQALAPVMADLAELETQYNGVQQQAGRQAGTTQDMVTALGNVIEAASQTMQSFNQIAQLLANNAA